MSNKRVRACHTMAEISKTHAAKIFNQTHWIIYQGTKASVGFLTQSIYRKQRMGNTNQQFHTEIPVGPLMAFLQHILNGNYIQIQNKYNSI